MDSAINSGLARIKTRPVGTKPYLDLTGQVFGRLTAQWPIARVHGHTWWLCSCQCGRLFLSTTNSLRTGNVKSCTCLRNEFHLTHGHTRGKHGRTNRASTEYRIWSAMIQRCTNSKCSAWEYYGGRGITVCQRWRKFENFLKDMGRRPGNLTIDRINNDGNYEPGNCRWATRSQQQFNRRPRRKS